MKLHEDKKLFRQAIQFTADQLGIRTIYVEKDYWVTYALYTIFNHEIGKETIFKGGTALSKCYNIIERFSEDIDLVVLRKDGETNNKLTNKIKTISEVVASYLPEREIEGLTQKRGMNRKTAHDYEKSFIGNFGQIRDVIVVEATWLGTFEPYCQNQVESFIGRMMLENNQEAIAREYNMQPFEVQTLLPERTICEKIMSLVRFSYSNNPMEDLKNKIRHAYDLHQLLKLPKYYDFVHSQDFEKMLIKVGKDDIASFKNNNDWLAFHPGEALIFKDLKNVWDTLKDTYSGVFSNLIYGNIPNENDIYHTLVMIKERIQSISWDMHPSK